MVQQRTTPTLGLMGVLVLMMGLSAPVLAQVLPPISTPTPGSTLTTSTVTFTGEHAGQAGEQHWLSVGTDPWEHSIFHQSLGTGHTVTVSGIFSRGTLFVRYHTYTPVAGWDSQLHTYTMNVASGTALTITPTTATLGVGVSVIPQGQMSVVSASSDGANKEKVLDGNSTTRWRPSGGGPHEMILALGGNYNVSEFRYLPFSWTKCTQYEVYVSTTNGSWGSAVASGTWANDNTEKTASFPPTPGAFLRIRYLDSYCYVAEHNVSGVVVGGGTPLTINPTSATVAGGGQQTFTGAGGTPPYIYSLVANSSSGASVNATTGQYTAGSTAGTSTVRVTDANQNRADAGVTVTAIATALTITPTTATLGVGGQQTFTGAGGSPAYTFSIVADTSGGATVNATTGLYTAGPNAGTSTVRVTDSAAATANATVTVQGSVSGDPGNPTLRWDRKLDSTNGSTVVGFEGCDSDRFKCIFGGTAVVDMETGLVWERVPDLAVPTEGWSGAIFHCATREVGGRKGWHLPMRDQLANLVDTSNVPSLPTGHPFLNVQAAPYWAATPSVITPTEAWGVRFSDGFVSAYSKSSPNSHMWCVRGGQSYDGVEY